MGLLSGHLNGPVRGAVASCGVLVTAAALLCAPAAAGVVQTCAERLTGEVAFRDGGLTVGGRTVPAAELLFVSVGDKGGTFRQTNTVRTTDGEVWHCEIVSLAAGKLKVHSRFFGTKELDKARVRAIEFKPRLAVDSSLEPGTLYRTSGEPLPGSILWISPTQVAVDSPLGAIAMERAGITRFILTKDVRLAAPAGEAEVVLADGTVLHGALAFGPDKVTVRHAALGDVALPAGAVRSVLMHTKAVAYLTELPLNVKAAPLLAAAPAVRTVDRRLSGRPAACQGAIRSLTIQPDTTLTFRLPKLPGTKRIFRACVAPLGGARCEVRLRVADGGKALLDRAVAREMKAPEPISVELPDATAMTIEVTFGPRVRLPCGVVLGDPHVVGR